MAVDFLLRMLNPFLTVSFKISSVPISAIVVIFAVRRISVKLEHVYFWIQSTLVILVFGVSEVTMIVIVRAFAVIFYVVHAVVVFVEAFSFWLFSDHDNFSSLKTTIFICTMRHPFFVVTLFFVVFVVFTVSFM